MAAGYNSFGKADATDIRLCGCQLGTVETDYCNRAVNVLNDVDNFII